MPQPTSVPGQPWGRQGPSRPTHRPLAFSITENMEKPAIAQAPVTVHSTRQAASGGCGPPRKRAASGSAAKAAQASKSSAAGGRRISRAVTRVGPRLMRSGPIQAPCGKVADGATSLSRRARAIKAASTMADEPRDFIPKDPGERMLVFELASDGGGPSGPPTPDDEPLPLTRERRRRPSPKGLLAGIAAAVGLGATLGVLAGPELIG